MRTYPVDSGATWTSVSAAVDQECEASERHRVDLAAIREKAKGNGITPEFLPTDGL